jgi:adenosylhomocysteine nucleosidase
MITIVVLISANQEWDAVREMFPQAVVQRSPFGEWFDACLPQPVTFFQGGWGKIAAAASTQYAIDHFAPDLVVNLGTCGGFEGRVAAGTVLLAERTLVYDVIEQMGDPAAAVEHYATRLDLSWLGERIPEGVQPALLVSADRDLVAQELPQLVERYGAIAGDWESGAIAWVCARNSVRCLILRGVSDLVGSAGGEIYGQIDQFASRARGVMRRLVEALPGWLAAISLPGRSQ